MEFEPVQTFTFEETLHDSFFLIKNHTFEFKVISINAIKHNL